MLEIQCFEDVFEEDVFEEDVFTGVEATLGATLGATTAFGADFAIVLTLLLEPLGATVAFKKRPLESLLRDIVAFDLDALEVLELDLLAPDLVFVLIFSTLLIEGGCSALYISIRVFFNNWIQFVKNDQKWSFQYSKGSTVSAIPSWIIFPK